MLVNLDWPHLSMPTDDASGCLSPSHGWITNVLRFRHFSMRGIANAWQRGSSCVRRAHAEMDAVSGDDIQGFYHQTGQHWTLGCKSPAHISTAGGTCKSGTRPHEIRLTTEEGSKELK